MYALCGTGAKSTEYYFTQTTTCWMGADYNNFSLHILSL